jgi:hypothetical protein
MPRYAPSSAIVAVAASIKRPSLSIFLLLLLFNLPTSVFPLTLLRNLIHVRQQQQQYLYRRQRLSGGEAGSESSFQEPLNLGRYPGQPSAQNDGTEGNGAYYSGNYNPAPDSWGDHNENTAREQSIHGSDYWKKNPYYDYFKKVWGNAPLLDSNFRLWMKGYFKSFKVPNQARSYQQTKALPSFLHYYGKTYDPLLDPPYKSEFDLFSSGSEGSESVAPPKIEGKTGAIRDDCTRSPFKNALGYKRPCGVNEILAKSWTREKFQLPLNKVLGKNSYWEGNHGNAGSQRGTSYWSYDALPKSPSEVGENPWIGLDGSWSSGSKMDSETVHPVNIPKPPKDPQTIPVFQLGEKKNQEEEAPKESRR